MILRKFPTSCQIFQEQNEFGWRHMVNGRIKLKWSELQADFFFRMNNVQKVWSHNGNS